MRSPACYRIEQFQTAPTVGVGELPRLLSIRWGGPVEILRIERRALDLRRGGRLCWNLVFRAGDPPPGKQARVSLRVRPVSFAPDPSPELTVHRRRGQRPLIVGAGVSGLIAGLLLTRAGCPPIILEQGRNLTERIRDVQRLHREGILCPESNVQFGLGGAGTFSDAKLNSRSKSPWRRYVLGIFHEFGAAASLLYDANPHIGTDGIRRVAAGLRDAIVAGGGEIRFSCRVEGLEMPAGRLSGLRLAGGERLEGKTVFLCPGNAARPLFRSLAASGIALAAKTIAVGFRLEHEQELIDRLIYRGRELRRHFGPASYRLTARDAWSFCVCPGGMVVNSSTEAGRLCLNGMSFSGRRGRCINGALITPVRPGSSADPLQLLAWQEEWETRAFQAGGGQQQAPAQEASAFLAGNPSGRLRWTSYRPAVQAADLAQIFPSALTEALRRGLAQFDRRFPGFADGLLLGIESRSSSPVTILRGADGQSPDLPGLYPCGEGAGYAGGILTSAIDGLEQVLCWLHDGRPYTNARSGVEWESGQVPDSNGGREE